MFVDTVVNNNKDPKHHNLLIYGMMCTSSFEKIHYLRIFRGHTIKRVAHLLYCPSSASFLSTVMLFSEKDVTFNFAQYGVGVERTACTYTITNYVLTKKCLSTDLSRSYEMLHAPTDQLCGYNLGALYYFE